MFNEQELEIIRAGKELGKTRDEVERVLIEYRTKGTPTSTEAGRTPIQKIGSVALGAVKGAVQGTVETARLMQTAGQGVLAAVDPTQNFQQIRERTGFQSLQGRQAEEIDALLASKNREETIGKITGAVLEVLAGGGAKLAVKGARAGASAIGKAVAPATEAVTEAVGPITRGVGQITKEIAERVPRLFEKARGGVDEAAARAERLAGATPQVQNAIKSGVDDVVVDFLVSADDPTKKAAREMVELAAQTRKLGAQAQPSIVAGKAAENAYDVIEANRKAIGQSLDDAIKALPDTKIDMRVSRSQLDSLLSENGIQPVGGKLRFAPERYTDAERLRLQEIWKRVSALPEQMTPRQIRDMDSLMSKLQRETRMEGLQDIYVTVNGENKSIFRVFRDVYGNQLENISPDIKDLNRQYANARRLIDDLDDTIFKTGGFDSAKGVEASEFAKVNLRRIMGESQSSTAYRGILEQMDEEARRLGYSGPRADVLADFAEELRTIFPKTIPKTGFQGGIGTSLRSVLDTALQLGKPTLTDQQKALVELVKTF
jgi:hypothetical protein